jgi:fucose permease
MVHPPALPPCCHRDRLFWAACAGLFVFGVVMVLPGTLFGMPEMRSRLQVTDMVRQGNLQTLLLFGVFLATIVTGPLIDRFGNKVVLANSALLATAGMTGFAAAHSYTAAEVCGLVLGAGGGGLNMGTNVLVSEAFAEDRGARLNLLAVFFGVGALFVPFTAAAAGPAHMNGVMLAAAAISGASMIAYLALAFPPAGEASGFSLGQAVKVLRYPGVLLFAFLLFFESGNEAAMLGWTSTWAGAMGANARTATLVLALFQAMMMVGRIGASRILSVISEARLMAVSGAGALLSVILIVSAPSAAVLAAGVALGGLTFASIYPTILAMAGDRFRSFAGTVFAVLFGVGLTGGMAFPWSIGHVSDAVGLRAGMGVPVLGAVMICGLLVVIRVRGQERNNHGLAPINTDQKLPDQISEDP